MSTIRWMHISDLHYNDEDMSTSELREQLPAFLEKEHILCDYVFFTGDVRSANRNKNDFPYEAAEYLKNLCHSVGTTEDRLFVVPGNHDVDRETPGRNEAIQKLFFQNRGYYDPVKGLIEEDDLRVIHSGQKDFRAFLKNLYADVDGRMDYYERPEMPHFVIETDNLNILHVDSTIVYTTDQEAHDLILGGWALRNALKQIDESKPVVLLTHYPITALAQEERKHVSELLYRRGIRLWLAGHEHDHMLQPINYIDCIQAGELKIDDRVYASALVGEYDTATLCGKILSYAWFPQGWAKYPIIRHGGGREDEYPFHFRLPADKGRSREAIKAERANKEYVMRLPQEVISELFPRIILEGNDACSTAGSENELPDLMVSTWDTELPHLIIRADGGMGKTTMLLDYCRIANDPVIYIPVERLVTIGMGIRQYCVQVIFDGNEKAFNDFACVKNSKPSLILLIDGLNEVDGNKERSLINEVIGLKLMEGLQFVITSRSDFTERFRLDGFCIGTLSELSDGQIKSFFSKEEWTTIQNSDTLHRLLSNPMMVTMYKDISPVIRRNLDDESLNWRFPIKNATDLLWDYYVAQIALLLERTGSDGRFVIQAFVATKSLLPAIGYHFEKSHAINMGNEYVRKLLKDHLAKSDNKSEGLQVLKERIRYYGDAGADTGELMDILVESMHLLFRSKGLTSFPHQIYRDFLSAVYIAENKTQPDILSIWSGWTIPIPVKEHIKNLSGNYWASGGLAELVHACAIETVDGDFLARNLIDCFPYLVDGGLPDYSGLDLRGIKLPDISVGNDRISLEGSHIDRVSIGKDVSMKPVTYSGLAFSDDDQVLAAFAKGRICIYDLVEDSSRFVYDIGDRINRAVFCDRYLFASVIGYSSRIEVFEKIGNWEYIGCLAAPADSYSGILSRSLSMIRYKDDILYFYYNNREARFDLRSCERIYNKSGKVPSENVIDGRDISCLKDNRNRKGKGKKDTECFHGDLKATSSADGSLKIYRGNELQRILEDGVLTLLDAAISGDGSAAATLSFDRFEGCRRIQLWDLKYKARTGEVFCPGEIEGIHMTDSGRFIIGVTSDRTWVFDRKEQKESWFEEFFVSNQKWKITSYGEKVLRKNRLGRLFLYDLASGESTKVDDFGIDARLACILKNGSIAVTDRKGRKVVFKNSGDGSRSEVNSQPASVIGLQDLRDQPFIAVATADDMISIYHTRTLQRTRKLEKTGGNSMMVIHPELPVIANSGRTRKFGLQNFYVKGNRGWWYSNRYNAEEHPINGDVLDLAFSSASHELVVILSNGEIMFCDEKYCRYQSSIDIITNINVDAYDFRGCICDEDVRSIIRGNGGEI